MGHHHHGHAHSLGRGATGNVLIGSLVLTIVFVVVLVISNLVGPKMCQVGPFKLSGAELLFPITYIFGDVFTEDLVQTWITYKRTNELDPIRLRPHPHEFYLYYDN